MKPKAWRDLLEAGWIVRLPTEAENAKSGNCGADTHPHDWLLQVDRTVPTLLTQEGASLAAKWRTEDKALADQLWGESRRQWEQSQQLGEFAPELKFVAKIVPPRDSADEKATEKQINYLNLLGVRDAGLLATLGKKQASELIEKIKELRGD